MPPPKGTRNPLEGPGDYTTTREVHSDTYPAIDPTKADFSGRSIFITGASKGVGRSTAISFARAGASKIAIGARSSLVEVVEKMKSAAAAAGREEPQVLSLKLDIADAESVTKAVETIATEFGSLDVLINNAGVLGSMGSWGDADGDAWWETLSINLRGPYLVTRACLPMLLQSELKTVINISSVGAILGVPGIGAYKISKLALIRMTDFAAMENAEQGLVAFSVHPGNMLTDMVGRGSVLPPGMKELFTETTELCADGLVFLCREKRDWLSGRYVNITWDLPELVSEAMVKKIVDGNLLKVTITTPSFE